MTFSKPQGNRIFSSLFGLLLGTLMAGSASAGQPEYMRLDFEKIQALEIKGEWDEELKMFVAIDIEELPQPRRPKLRGMLQGVDPEHKTIKMYGIVIEIDEQTQFLDEGDGKIGIGDLKKDQWLEMTCNYDEEDHKWEARKISFKNIKESKKIKGTLTAKSIDGEPPDTIEIHGLRILLDRKTDVNYPGSSMRKIEDDLFDELSLVDALGSDNGVVAGEKFLLGGSLRETSRSEVEYDLSGTYPSDQRDAQPDIRLEATGYFNDKFRGFGQLRIRGRVFVDSDRINPAPKTTETDITQLFLLAKNIGIDGFAVQLGRLDFDEPREWLFDEYLDAVRLYYYGRQPLIFEAAYIHSDFQIKDQFNTWTDLFVQTRWRPDGNNTVRGYLLKRKDIDIRNREPVWWGAGYMGKVGHYFTPWVELAIMRGTDKGRSLKASAMDIGVTAIADDIRFLPTATLSYARGSGDGTGTDDNEFRQTGYEDNTGYFGGVRTFQYYGEVLNPELSNLKIFAFSIGARPTDFSSIELIYHKYTQDQMELDEFRGDLVYPPARTNGISDELGWGLDFAVGLSNLWDRVHFGWVFGIFQPGDAFLPFTERATINKFNLKIDI